jgi:hypothetical protein
LVAEHKVGAQSPEPKDQGPVYPRRRGGDAGMVNRTMGPPSPKKPGPNPLYISGAEVVQTRWGRNRGGASGFFLLNRTPAQECRRLFSGPEIGNIKRGPPPKDPARFRNRRNRTIRCCFCL